MKNIFKNIKSINKFRIGKYMIENVSADYDHQKFGFYISHKYWYLWNIFIDFLFIHIYIEICRTDWNRCYKNTCKNYTDNCKHCMDCNAGKECYKSYE